MNKSFLFSFYSRARDTVSPAREAASLRSVAPSRTLEPASDAPSLSASPGLFLLWFPLVWWFR